ncbi:4184_t:CDS:2, partial [Cetraspora pellucida]
LNQTLSKQVETFAVNNFTNYNIGIHLREKKKTHGLKTPVEHFSEAVKLLMFGMKNMNITIFVAADSNNEESALIDMKLLSLCDDLVITYGSSFGFVSSAWSLKASRPRGPFVIMPIKNSSEDFYDAVKVWVWGATSMSLAVIDNIYVLKFSAVNRQSRAARRHFDRRMEWPLRSKRSFGQ